MQFNSFAWMWAEGKYLSYLKDDHRGYDGDFFFWGTKDDTYKDIAEKNIANMSQIRKRYLAYVR